jgi:hypothetical protein
MAGGRDLWRAGAWGAGCGMLGGLAFDWLCYVVEKLLRPDTSNGLTFIIGAPVFAVLGALVGLLAAAWYSSD